MSSEDECLIPDSPHTLVDRESEYFKLLGPAICKIVKRDGCGSGFLYQVSKDSKDFYGLFTNNHVLHGYQHFFLAIETQHTRKSFTPKKIKWVFTDPYLDVSYFCLDKEEFSEAQFLKECVNPIDIKTECAVIQYPSIIQVEKKERKENNDNHLYEASGKVTNYSGHFIVYEVSTSHGSSGGAIVVPNTAKVFGIHRRGNKYIGENYGTIIRDVIEMICWEKNKRVFYSSDFLQVNDPSALQSLQSSVCKVQFSSFKDEKTSGFLCILKHEESYLKGIFTTRLKNNFKREFEALFYAGNRKLCVKEEDIGLVFAHKTFSFLFMVFTGDFIKSKLNQLTFLSVSEDKPSDISDLVSGRVSEIDKDCFPEGIPYLPGSPIFNKNKEVISIVTLDEKGKLIPICMTDIREFIFKKRYFESRSEFEDAAVYKVTDLDDGQVSTGCLVTFRVDIKTKFYGLFKFGETTKQTFQMHFEGCKTTFQISQDNAKIHNIGISNWAFVNFDEILLYQLSTKGVTFLTINTLQPAEDSPIVVYYHQNGREVTTTKREIKQCTYHAIFYDAVVCSIGAPIINEKSEVIAFHNVEPPGGILTHVYDEQGKSFEKGIRIFQLHKNLLNSIKILPPPQQ